MDVPMHRRTWTFLAALLYLAILALLAG